MALKRQLAVAVIATLVFTANLHAAEVSPAVQAKFSQALAFMQQKKFVEALPLLRELAVELPEAPGIFGNLGLTAAEVGDHELALAARLRYRELMPEDLQGISRVMESYQALGRTRERDAARDQVIARWSAMSPEEKQQNDGFVRDQFMAGGFRVIAVEYFEPAPPLRRLYRFQVLNADGSPAYFFGLESGDPTTEVARELGEIRKDQRIYSLDRYQRTEGASQHSTFGLMAALPSYDAVRTMVTDTIEGRQ